MNGMPLVTGIVWQHSKFALEDVADGQNCTYMAGEKYVDFDAATTGRSYGDCLGPYVSDDRDVIRWAAWTSSEGNYPAPGSPYYAKPYRDMTGSPVNPNDAAWGLTGLGTYNFGSAHPNGFNMAMCDASVRHINYEIDEVIHRQLSNRLDGNKGYTYSDGRVVLFEVPE